MSETVIIQAGTKPTVKVGPTFTGQVLLELLHQGEKAATANVTFTPCARTHWHTHEDGQILRVITGHGWICDKGGVPQKIKAGDVIFAPAGTTHWHGADEGSLMTHFVVGLGKTTWHEAVTDEEYKLR